MRWLLIATVVASTLICTSCGGSGGRYPVKGKVLVNGEPAKGATVTFVRRGATDPAQEQTAQGVVQEDGSFSLAGPAGKGAAPGDYIVLVEWKEGAGKVKGRGPSLGAPDRLKKKYLDTRNPLLTAKVEPKSNTLPPFELQ
jgi:hypothetical protein